MGGRHADQDRLIQSIINDHPELARDRPFLARLINAKGFTEDSLKVFKYLNLIKPGGYLAKAQAALTRLSLPGISEVLFILDTLHDIGKANLAAVDILGRKAYAYGVTAWAFRHSPPPVPPRDLELLSQWISGERRAALGAIEWVKMRDAAITAMNRRCASLRIYAADFKLLLRLRYEENPQKLARAIYTGFVASASTFDREAHEALSCDYPM